MQRDSRHRTGAVYLYRRLALPTSGQKAAPGAGELQLVGWMLDSPRSLGSGQTGRRPRLDSRVLRQGGGGFDSAARSPPLIVPPPPPLPAPPRPPLRGTSPATPPGCCPRSPA